MLNYCSEIVTQAAGRRTWESPLFSTEVVADIVNNKQLEHKFVLKGMVQLECNLGGQFRLTGDKDPLAKSEKEWEAHGV